MPPVNLNAIVYERHTEFVKSIEELEWVCKSTQWNDFRIAAVLGGVQGYCVVFEREASN